MLRRLFRRSLAVLVAAGCAEGSPIEDGAGSGDGSGGAGSGGGRPATSSTSATTGVTTGATTSGSTTTTGAGGDGGFTGGGGDGGSGTGALTPQACPTNQFMTGVDTNGQIVCELIDPSAQAAINQSCSVFHGWRDSCTGCTLAPAKWGSVSQGACANGLGGDNTCTQPSLGGLAVRLFGLNTDGDVNDDDKFYTGFSCSAGSSTPVPAPCVAGELAVGLSGTQITCAPASGAILDYVRTSCSVYTGWRDSCDACTSAPSKWGRASTTSCSAGVGTGNTCTTATLGGTSVQLFGLNTGGDVDGNDKMYVGLRCTPPPAAVGSATGTCPAGRIMTGIEAGGAITCASPAPLVASYFAAHCTIYYGWSDNCDGCTAAPVKWGRAREGFCTNDVGGDSTCQDAVLGADTVRLFGLNTDGDVNGDDKFYVGFRCD